MVIWDPVILLPWQLDVTTSPHYFPKTNFSTRLTHPSVFPRRTAFAQPRKTFQFWRNETAAHFSCMPGACVKQLRLWCFLQGCWLQLFRELFSLYLLWSGILWFLQNHFQFFPRRILRNQYFHPPELRYWSHLSSKRKTKKLYWDSHNRITKKVFTTTCLKKYLAIFSNPQKNFLFSGS